MNPRLRVEVGRQVDFEYEIPPVEEEEAVWIGRGGFCQVRLADHQLSRRHCELTYEDGHLNIRDLGSHNGTRVNDKLIDEQVELDDGDTITLGQHVLRVIHPAQKEAREGGPPKGGLQEEELEIQEQLQELIGTEFGGFEIEKMIFDGEWSAIFRARDPEKDIPVAVKVMKPLPEVRVEDRNRFIRGAKHSATLRHPNFVRVFKGGRQGEWYYIAMEYVPGKNLQQFVEHRGGPLELQDAVKIIGQVLDALQYAYEQDLVFRATRPDNILVLKDLRIKLTDFDLVKPLTGRQDAQVTRVMDGSVRVSPEFAAPELIAYPVVADQKADVFGAGAVLYFMLSANAPFSTKLPKTSVSSAFDRKARDLKRLNPSVPDGVLEVIGRAMSDYERYNSPGEMKQGLQRAVSGAGD